MSLGQLVRTDVVTATRGTAIREAASSLAEHNIGSLVVVEGDRPVGVLTDRDIALKVVAKGLDPEATVVGDVMSQPVRCLEEGDGLFGAIDEMAEHGIRRLPVVDDRGRLVGLLTLDDLLTLLVAEFALLEGVLLAQSKVGRQSTLTKLETFGEP